MNRKQSSTKKSSSKKGKAEGSKGKADRARARRIIESNRYGDKVTAKLRRALDGSPDTLRDILVQLDEIERKADAHKKGAHEYAQKAYMAALDHYTANVGDLFALSRLAVVYGETNPEDVHMVVTLPGVMRGPHVDDEIVRGWIKTAELLARTLEHPECTEAFRDAFGAIYTEEMLEGSGISWTNPEVLRVQLPLIMLAGSKTNHVCDDDKALSILTLLSCELVSDETDRAVRKSLGMQ
jgi:hypothetical protein